MWQKNGQKRSYNSYKRVTFISEHSLPVNVVVVDVDEANGSSLHPPSFRGRRLRGWYLYSGWSRLCLSLSLSASLWNGVFSSSFKILEKNEKYG